MPNSYLRENPGGTSTPRDTQPVRASAPIPLLVFLLIWTVVAVMQMGACRGFGPQPAPTPVGLRETFQSISTRQAQPTTAPQETTPAGRAVAARSINILLDDFKLQPYQGESVYFFNRVEGDRGAVNNSKLAWGNGHVRLALAPGTSWGGMWMALNHPIREGLSLNFSAILPPQISPAFQSQVTGITAIITGGTPNKRFRLELKDGDELRWKTEIALTGTNQVLSCELPPLANINQLVVVLDGAAPGDYVDLERLSLTATTNLRDTATIAFVWSYGMLLNNWDPATGLVRDKAKDASGEFDAVQATGSLAAATAMAEQLGVVTRADATQIVNKISQALLVDLPRFHGLWPHWVKRGPTGALTIVPNTEWSSVDTVIAALGLLSAQSGLGMDTTATEQMLRAIEWNGLIIPGGISHGYTFEGPVIPYAWDIFGGESWLVELAYVGVTGQVAPIAYPNPQTANGSGFIDELAWLFVPPPSGQDYWGTDWTAYRATASDLQTSYYPTHYSTSCFTQLGLFGLSASEVPDPARVSKESIYQAFGVGGHFTQANDGASLFGAPVVVPHYSAMIASLHPEETIKVWDRLIESGYLTPINNVESIMFPPDSNCSPESVVWNDLKGSWNLALQTIGWGRYLAERDGYVPILWQATSENALVRKGYLALAPHGPLGTPTPIRNDTSAPSPSTLTLWTLSRECENPDEMTVGQIMERSAALGSKVHGQFGTMVDPLWPARSGYVKYRSLFIPQRERLYLRLRYSKYSLPGTPILISIDDELSPRAKFYPVDQGDWNNFAWSESIPLGSITQGTHSLKFYTDGQQYGVADLDLFILTGESPAVAMPEISEKSGMVPITQTIPVHWVPMKTPLSIEATVYVRVTETVLEWVTATPSPQP